MNKNFNDVVDRTIKALYAEGITSDTREIVWKLSCAADWLKAYTPQFDAYEVHPVVLVDKSAFEQATNENDPNIYGWGLYGHTQREGIMWLNDFSSQERAERAMRLLQEQADIKIMGSVSLLVSTYEWVCPHCDMDNDCYDVPETVECADCGHVFTVRSAVHVGK